tara:strand:+ start:2942 stop:3166 length:225 start_codon:yes stop_codon:yes gene_type:complete
MPPQVLFFFVLSTVVSVGLIFAETIVAYNIGAFGRLGFNIPSFDKIKLLALNVVIFYVIGTILGMITQQFTYLN